MYGCSQLFLIKLFISVHPLLEDDIGLNYTHETKQDFIKSAHLIKDKILCYLFVCIVWFRVAAVVCSIVEMWGNRLESLRLAAV